MRLTEGPAHHLLEQRGLPGPADSEAAVLRHVPGNTVDRPQGLGEGELHHAGAVARHHHSDGPHYIGRVLQGPPTSRH